MRYISTLILALLFVNCSAQETKMEKHAEAKFAVVKTEAEWKAQLTDEEFNILRNKGTERAWTGKYNKEYSQGKYNCKACNTVLFTSESKFDSGSGWPSFDEPVNTTNVITEVDNKFGMRRTEILCGTCGGHLGHVFNDGPTETGERYCVNSLSLTFKPKK